MISQKGKESDSFFFLLCVCIKIIGVKTRKLLEKSVFGLEKWFTAISVT